MMEALIWVRFEQVGFHCWPGGPQYLANSHRHLFEITVTVVSTVDDKRSIEFHDLLRTAKEELEEVSMTTRGRSDTYTPDYDFGSKSCETIAMELAKSLAHIYRRNVMVDVAEDDECGASVTYEAPDY